MLRGRFGDTSGTPYVEGQIKLPNFGLSSDISFLVDTGADRTELMPLNGLIMGLDYSRLSAVTSVRGIDGRPFNQFEELAVVTFSEARKNLYIYEIDIVIAPPTRYNRDIASILGRDILNRWEMIYRPANPRKYLGFKVISADHILPIP